MSKRMSSVAGLLLAVAVAVTAAPAAAGSYGHDREGLVLGFNLGLGEAKVEWEDEGFVFESDTESGGAGGIRIGYAFDPRFLLAFEGTGWMREYDDGEITLNTALIMFTWYPQGKGFFLRTGFGAGQAEVTLEGPGFDVTWDEGGGAFDLGLGHEWRLTEKFALGAALDHSIIAIDDFGIDGAGTATDVKTRYTSVTAQLNWYF